MILIMAFVCDCLERLSRSNEKICDLNYMFGLLYSHVRREIFRMFWEHSGGKALLFAGSSIPESPPPKTFEMIWKVYRKCFRKCLRLTSFRTLFRFSLNENKSGSRDRSRSRDRRRGPNHPHKVMGNPEPHQGTGQYPRHSNTGMGRKR